MLFTNKVLTTLEFDKIINMLADCALTEGAKARARALVPTDDYDVIIRRQTKTEDAKRLINAKGYPAFTAEEGVVSSAERAYKGAILSPRELLDIAALLKMTPSAISHQLRILKEAKLVKYRREGKTVFYALADDHVRTILGQGMDHITE